MALAVEFDVEKARRINLIFPEADVCFNRLFEQNAIAATPWRREIRRRRTSPRREDPAFKDQTPKSSTVS